MPFLSRADWGGPFDAYYKALANLGAEFVRFAPWHPDPRVFKDGYCRDASPSCLPAYPWEGDGAKGLYGNQGSELADPTCETMARYIGRVVGHFTAGGHHDECGHWHPSGLHYKWWGLSILNENEHSLDANTILCYDAIVAEVKKINPDIVPVGPELVGDDPTQSALLHDFLNSSNHRDNRAPPVVSYHLGSDSQDDFWSDWDGFLYGPEHCDPKTSECTGVVPFLDGLKEAGTELVINEVRYVPMQRAPRTPCRSHRAAAPVYCCWALGFGHRTLLFRSHPNRLLPNSPE